MSENEKTLLNAMEYNGWTFNRLARILHEKMSREELFQAICHLEYDELILSKVIRFPKFEGKGRWNRVYWRADPPRGDE